MSKQRLERAVVVENWSRSVGRSSRIHSAGESDSSRATYRTSGGCLLVRPLSLSLQIVVSHIVSGGLVTSVWYRIPQYSSTNEERSARPHPPRRPRLKRSPREVERDAGRDKGQRGGRGAPWLPRRDASRRRAAISTSRCIVNRLPLFCDLGLHEGGAACCALRKHGREGFLLRSRACAGLLCFLLLPTIISFPSYQRRLLPPGLVFSACGNTLGRPGGAAAGASMAR